MSAELFHHGYLYLRPTRRGRVEVEEFLQNFLHDAESLWWVVLWSLARLDPWGRDLSRDEAALGRRKELYLGWFPISSRRRNNVFDRDLSAAIKDTILTEELPVAYRPIQNILKDWREAVTDCIFETESTVVGKIVLEGMNDVHLDVDRVINSKENLDAARQVGELELVKDFPE
jgi:hypothetical protein